MTLGHIVKILKTKGHRVHVIHTREPKQGETQIKSIPLPGYSEVRIGLPSPMKLRKRWLKKRPDVIYVATESPLGISALNAAKELNIPTAAGFHTNFQQYIEKYSLEKFKNVAMTYLKNVHDKADCTLTPSPDSVKMLRDEGYNNVQLLGRGVDTEQFNAHLRSEQLRARWGAEKNSPVILVVGRLAPEKNLELAVESMRLMQKKNPLVKGVFVGDGPSRKKLADANPDLYFAGMREGEDLASHYASADILLFPSETETFGNVLLEGMASSLVTVSYNYAASKVYIKNEINGFHAEKGNKEAFLASSLTALEHWQDQTIKTAAQQSITALSWQKVVDTFEQHLLEIIRKKSAHTHRCKPDQQLQARALFLSDIHLGCPESKTEEVIDLIKRTNTPRIYLNGDIIDAWALKRGEKWTSQHTKVIRVLLRKMENEGTQLIYLRGNHDDILDNILPVTLGGIKIQTDVIHESFHGKKYLIVHGDGFDSFSTKHKWVAKIGAFGYDALLKLNRFYNTYRRWIGKEPYSVSKAIKQKVKSAVNFVEKYQEQVQQLARKRKCDGIICGHIHKPANENYNGVHYLNSGDWVEECSCVIEYPDGRFEVLHYTDFCIMLSVDQESPTQAQVAKKEELKEDLT